MASRYDRLVERTERILELEHVEWLLKWDQEVKMPAGGTPARSRQKSQIASIRQEHLTDEEFGQLIARIDRSTLDADQQAVVREMERRHERAVRAPDDVVAAISRAKSEAFATWQEAKRKDDFDVFAPSVEKLLSLEREYADSIDPDADPFAVSFQRYEPYLSLDTVEAVLMDLKDALVPLIDDIKDSDVTIERNAFAGTYDPDVQLELVDEMLDIVGFDREHSRLDTAPHPFANGTPFDARLSTRLPADDLINGITTSLHEFGHAAYTLNLPREQYGTPLAEPRDYSIHESQSRFWENHVGRTEAFWETMLPTITDHFPSAADVTPREAYRAANAVFEDNPVRTEADELTYHLHIIVRFELVRDLFSGDVSVDEIPQVWREKMREYLGVEPDTAAEGFMQDIHWSHGQFSYFPTYSIGSVFAAQLRSVADDELALDSLIRNREFDRIDEFLVDRVQRHGQRYPTDELVEVATGEPLDAEHFIEYVSEKYGRLYDL